MEEYTIYLRRMREEAAAGNTGAAETYANAIDLVVERLRHNMSEAERQEFDQQRCRNALAYLRAALAKSAHP